MAINKDAHADRVQGRRSEAASTGIAKLIADIDPETTTLDECNAALGAAFSHYTKYAAESRKPKLFKMGGDDGFMMTGTTYEEPADNERPEQLFVKEILGNIPEDERPKKGSIQQVTSLKAVATAIVTMARDHEWKIAIPVSQQARLNA